MEYRERMKLLREKHALTPEQAAGIIGRSERSYNSIENGNTKLRIRELIALCEYYQVTADYLIGLTDKPERSLDYSVSE